jgi:hypothetical protein
MNNNGGHEGGDVHSFFHDRRRYDDDYYGGYRYRYPYTTYPYTRVSVFDDMLYGMGVRTLPVPIYSEPACSPWLSVSSCAAKGQQQQQQQQQPAEAAQNRTQQNRQPAIDLGPLVLTAGVAACVGALVVVLSRKK